MIKPSKGDVEAAVLVASSVFTAEFAIYAYAHEILGLEWGDLFPLLAEYGVAT